MAKQFEGVFVQMMLKSMRQALPEGGLLSNEQTKLYTSMYDQQIAQDMSNKGLGMADMMVEQLTGGTKQPSELAGTVPMALDNEVLKTLPIQAMEQYLRKAIPAAPDRSTAAHRFPRQRAVRLNRHPAPVAYRQRIPHQLIMRRPLESGGA